ncbi:MAG: hypothetical protein AAGA30_17115, partial [Planctomycetota bacterium]
MFLVGSVHGDIDIDFEQTPGGLSPIDNAQLDRNAAYIGEGVAVTFGFDTDGDGATDENAVFEKSGADEKEGFISTFGTSMFDSERQDSVESLGGFSIRGNLAGGVLGDFWIAFDADVDHVKGEVWDIDAFANGQTYEQWRVTAFDNDGNQVASMDSPRGLAFDDPASLDSLAWVFSLRGDGIRRVRIKHIGTSEDDQRGFLFNNIEASVNESARELYVFNHGFEKPAARFTPGLPIGWKAFKPNDPGL